MLSLSSDNPTATGLLPLSLPAGLPRPGSSTGAPEASPGGVGVTRLAPRGAATARRGAASFGGGGNNWDKMAAQAAAAPIPQQEKPPRPPPLHPPAPVWRGASPAARPALTGPGCPPAERRDTHCGGSGAARGRRHALGWHRAASSTTLSPGRGRWGRGLRRLLCSLPPKPAAAVAGGATAPPPPWGARGHVEVARAPRRPPPPAAQA